MKLFCDLIQGQTASAASNHFVVLLLLQKSINQINKWRMRAEKVSNTAERLNHSLWTATKTCCVTNTGFMLGGGLQLGETCSQSEKWTQVCWTQHCPAGVCAAPTGSGCRRSAATARRKENDSD